MNADVMTSNNVHEIAKLIKTYTLSLANANLLTLAIAFFGHNCLTARDNVSCSAARFFSVMKMNIQ